MSVWYNVQLDGFGFYAEHVQSDPSDINNRTRGDRATFDLKIATDPPDLVVAAGETRTVESGTIEIYNDVTVNGDLTVNGILVVYGTLNVSGGSVDSSGGTINNLSQNPFERVIEHDRHAGSYSLTGTLGNAQRYKERLPANPNISSLVVGLEPATQLQDKRIIGKWGLIRNITDNRTRALTNPVVSLEIDILADYPEYSDVADVQSALEI